MEIAGLGVASLDELFKIVSFLREVLSDALHFGQQANALRIRMDDEQLRLRALQQLLFTNPLKIRQSAKCLFHEFEIEWQFTILEMLRQLRTVLAEYIPIQIEYQLARPQSVLNPTVSDVQALTSEFQKGSKTWESSLQASTSCFFRWKFASADKKRAEKLIKEFTEWNDRIQKNLELVVLRAKVLEIQQASRFYNVTKMLSRSDYLRKPNCNRSYATLEQLQIYK